ncbi:MAG TPA: single-stranded DNA-binding protein [Niabella sp.]|nr:single-stranded DNA-binding protein [Niabella sp.]
MQTIIGRLTANATIKETKDGRKLVAFTIAQNDRFKVKGSDEVKQVTNYFNCAYWIATGIAEHLKKGLLVEVTGRIGVNAWKNMDGDAKASLTLHVQHIQLHGKVSAAQTEKATTAEPVAANDKEDDLPF